MARRLSKVVVTAPVSTDHATQPPSVTSRYFSIESGPNPSGKPEMLASVPVCLKLEILTRDQISEAVKLLLPCRCLHLKVQSPAEEPTRADWTNQNVGILK